MTIRALIAAWLSALLVACAQAAPIADAERIPVDVRRTTLLVNDAERSLALYRDALGLTVIYDQLIESPMDNGETRRRRLVLLRANDDFVGVLGLLQYIHPEKPQRQERFDEPVPGDPIIVINAADLDSRWPRVAASPGVEVVDPPERVEYPRADGGTIRVNVSMIRDPDGYWLEINQLLDAPARAAD